MIPLAEADFPSLKQFATVNLGLEVKQGTNATTLRGMIAAADNTVAEVPEFSPEGAGTPRRAATPQMVTPQGSPSTAIIEPGVHDDPNHWSHDPQVTLEVAKSADPTRPKDVTIQVNGDVFRMQRGVEVSVPYRVFEAIKNAKENQAVDSGEINPLTGMPIYTWEPVLSYPYQVTKHPTEEEVAEWRANTSKGFQQRHAA